MKIDVAWIVAIIPGVLVVAVLAFPMLFFPRWHVLLRLLGSCITVVAGLGMFGAILGHE